MNEINYHEYLPLIKQQVSKHTKDPVIFEELMGYANEAFVKAQHSWIPEKGKFSTHLVWCLRLAINNGKRFAKFGYADEELSDETSICSEKAVFFKELINNLSNEAKEVAMLVLESPMELLELASDSIRLKTIKNYLRKIGWKHHKIDLTIKELKENFH